MSQSWIDRIHQITRLFGMAVLVCAVVATIGCGGAISSSHNQNGDPLGLGAGPGPAGSTTPQMIEVRLGSEPSDRIVSLSLTANSLQAVNSGAGQIDLLTAPITFEFTRSAIDSEPIFVGQIYQDTYSALVFPAMTGQVVFYDLNGQRVSQALSVPGQTVPLTSNLVLGPDNPVVLSISLDLTKSFTITDTGAVTRFAGMGSQADSSGSSSFGVNSLSIATGAATPNPVVGQPEAGSISFIVGKVTSVDTTNKKINVQPTSGDAIQVVYDLVGGTEFVNCDQTMLTNMMVETEGVTLANGSVFASEVEMVDNSQSGSELYGILSGYAPDGMNYNLIAEGGVGVNVTTGLIGKSITVDWLAAGYEANNGKLDLSGSQDLVFDEIHAFPGQFVEIEWDALIVPDPDSSNAGYMQPRMFELEEQTLTGQVGNYNAGTGTFTLAVASNSTLKNMNPGLTSVAVREVPQTYLRNGSFKNGDTVSVRGLLFVDPNYSNVNYHPSPTSPVAFIMVADRISK
jgi:hypothetical protein